MFLQLNHTKLLVYQNAKQLILECYKLTSHYPLDERNNLTKQIRRAANSILLNISEGSSRKSKTERARYFEIARGSVIELDAAFDISFHLGYFADKDIQILEKEMKSTFIHLSLLLKQLNSS